MPSLALPAPLAGLLLFGLIACSSAREGEHGAWQVSGSPWRTDPIWFDGQAETCEYEGRLEIYGVSRSFRARVHTLHQHMDPATTTKAEGAQAQRAPGIGVFKQIATERVPTESYEYYFSITSFTRSDDLALYKLTRSVQEECGASFTQIWREGARLATLESGYFPGEGIRRGELGAALVAFDQLPLVLRDFPFAAAGDDPLELRLDVLPSLRTNRLTPLEPEPRIVRHAGSEELDLPFGRVATHRLELSVPGGPVEATYWFHADGGAPWLHALVALEGPGGSSYRLVSHGRARYWERP